MIGRAFTLAALVILWQSIAVGQSPADLDTLHEKLKTRFHEVMPGWEGKRGEPIQGDKNVLVEFWTDSSRNRIVKISIVPRASVEEARNAIEEFVKYDREKEQLRGFGDDGYAWGYGLSNVVFRRGKLTVFVSTMADVDADSDARLLSKDQKAARMKSEMSRLSKDVAKQVATAIDQH
jgi:hypothetical protein